MIPFSLLYSRWASEWVGYFHANSPISDWPHSPMNLKKERQTHSYMECTLLGSLTALWCQEEQLGPHKVGHMYGLGQKLISSQLDTPGLSFHQNQTHSKVPKTSSLSIYNLLRNYARKPNSYSKTLMMVTPRDGSNHVRLNPCEYRGLHVLL